MLDQVLPHGVVDTVVSAEELPAKGTGLEFSYQNFGLIHAIGARGGGECSVQQLVFLIKVFVKPLCG